MRRLARVTLAVSLLAAATALASRTVRAQGVYGYHGRYRHPVIILSLPQFYVPPPPPRVIVVVPRPVYPPYPYGW